MAPSTPIIGRALTVSELTRKIKQILEGQVGSVTVEGEVSNFKRQSSGHCYFTLKDATAQLPTVWFRGNQRPGSIEVKDGIMVRADGDLSVYEPRGTYQLVVRRLAAAGQGALQQKFEELKEKLQQEGLFAPERKKPLPPLPQRIGLVTSPTGAVIRDMLNVFGRRFPNLHFFLTPVRVQGPGAADEIAAAIDLLNQDARADIIIVARGGGSLEDLWAFNEEIVARSIARSAIPVISAVGHETDFTISDFVADLRAPTPSAAAELAVQSKEAFEQRLDEFERSLANSVRQHMLGLRHDLLVCSSNDVFREPRQILANMRERLTALKIELPQHLQEYATNRRHALELHAADLAHDAATMTLRTRSTLSLMRQGMLADLKRQATRQRQVLTSRAVHLTALSPFGVLNRGYSITTLEDGRIVRDLKDVKKGQTVRTRLGAGAFLSNVTQIEDTSQEKKS